MPFRDLLPAGSASTIPAQGILFIGGPVTLFPGDDLFTATGGAPFTPLYINGGVIDPGDGTGLYLPERSSVYVVTLMWNINTIGGVGTYIYDVILQAGSAQQSFGSNNPFTTVVTDNTIATYQARQVTSTVLTTTEPSIGNVSIYPDVQNSLGSAGAISVVINFFSFVEIVNCDVDNGTVI